LLVAITIYGEKILLDIVKTIVYPFKENHPHPNISDISVIKSFFQNKGRIMFHLMYILNENIDDLLV
jgi:hypothetical protein